MTKSIRIENADNSQHKVRVFTEDLQANGEWVRDPKPIALDYPTQMDTRTIHAQRRLVIEEVSE
jgi:hypothetical protein